MSTRVKDGRLVPEPPQRVVRDAPSGGQITVKVQCDCGEELEYMFVRTAYAHTNNFTCSCGTNYTLNSIGGSMDLMRTIT